MQQKQIYILMALLTILALTLSACGSASNQSVIATSVAMTVQAQNTQQAQSTPTSGTLSVTDTPSPLASPTAEATKAPPTAPAPGSNGTNFCTASAMFMGETIPDGTIEPAGAQFTKVWKIKNTGTCAWDSTWQFVYVSGDVMGGAYYYQFPQPAAPGDTVNVPVVFTAPTADGTYTGYWKIKSPWGAVFGDTDSGNPFWVQIVVGTGAANGITSVTYTVTHTGICTDANMFFTITASISSNGPVKITYYWQHDDGTRSSKMTLNFTQADTKTVSETLSWRIGSTNKEHWDQIVITNPVYQEFGKATYSRNCQ